MPTLAANLSSSVPGMAMVPTGTVAPDQNATDDIVLAYRNFGDVDLWGADFSAQIIMTQEWSMTVTGSYVSDEFFVFEDEAEIALNAPTVKGAIGLLYDNARVGFDTGIRARYTDGFPMDSGVYRGDVESYGVLDFNIGYVLPSMRGARLSLIVNNILDNLHQEWVGAPEMGRMAMLRVEYAF